MMLFHRLKIILVLGITLFLVAITSAPTYAQLNKASEQISVEGAPVMLGRQTILILENGIGSFSVEERANAVSDRINDLANDSNLEPNAIRVDSQGDVPKLFAGDQFILAVTSADARTSGQTPQALAARYRQQIITALEQDRAQFIRADPRIVFPLIAAATLAVIVIFISLNRIFEKILAGLRAWRQDRISGISAEDLILNPYNRIFQLSIGALKLLKLVTRLIVFFIYGTFVLSQFPRQARLADSIRQIFLRKLTIIWSQFVSSIPNLLIIALGIFICYTATKLVNSIFKALERGSLSIPGFYPEWASISSKLVNFFIIGFTLALLFPLVPGYESDAFKGVFVFLGALISFGATSAVANILASIQLTYSRAFRAGDIVKVGDTWVEILDLRLLITRFRTFENEIITIANSQLLDNEIINYSASARDYNVPLMLHTTITLGYDIPLTEVHQTLIAAASTTAHILKEPAPFVWQMSLDDFYVSYQLNAYTEQPKLIYTIYSELHGNILRKCDEAGIEILSPHYAALRDGNDTTLSPGRVDQGSTVTGFRIYPVNRNSDS